MPLPDLNLDALPNLENAHGIFGSLSDAATALGDDRTIVVMIYVYEGG